MLTHTEIVEKLIGRIDPAGDSSLDDKRFENLKTMCELVGDLVAKIDKVSYENQGRYEFSIKRSAEYAKNFLTNELGIKE